MKKRPISNSDYQIVAFEGKTISELNGEKDILIADGKMEDAKLIAQKTERAGEAYYFSALESFEEKFASMGLGIYFNIIFNIIRRQQPVPCRNILKSTGFRDTINLSRRKGILPAALMKGTENEYG